MSNIDSPKATARKFLTKDEELALGRLIQQYLKAKEELNTSDSITHERKQELDNMIKEGMEAAEVLFKANMGLVYDRARMFKASYPRGPEFEDLVQEGSIGLLTAVTKFDPDRGNKFATMAYYWIAQSVGRGVNKTGRLVRLPENRINENSKINKIINSAEAEGLTPAELDELIMSKLNISKNDLRNIRNAASTPASLNKVVANEGGNNKELMEFIAEQNPMGSSEQALILSEMRKALGEALSTLSPIKQEIILCSFNLDDNDDRETPEQLRMRHGIVPFAFKRMQTEAIEEMRTALTQAGYSFEDFAIAS